MPLVPSSSDGDVPKVGYFRNIPDEFKIKSLYSNDLILNIASKSKETVQKLKFLDSPARPEVYSGCTLLDSLFQKAYGRGYSRCRCCKSSTYQKLDLHSFRRGLDFSFGEDFGIHDYAKFLLKALQKTQLVFVSDDDVDTFSPSPSGTPRAVYKDIGIL